MLNFIIIAVIPLAHVRQTIFGLVPILLITSYVQAQEKVKFFRSEFEKMPPNLKEKVEDPEAFVLSYMTKMLIIGGIFIFAHYV